MIPHPTYERYLLRLRLTQRTVFHFLHGGALRGLLSRALGEHELPPGLVPFACESGRVLFEPGEPYHLGLTVAGAARERAEMLFAGLRRLGAPGAVPLDPPPTLGGNFEIETIERLPAIDLESITAALAGREAVELQLLSPLRIERPEPLRERGAGFLNDDCFPAECFLERLWQRLFLLAEGRYPTLEERVAMPLVGAVRAVPGRLLWIDLPVPGTLRKGRPYTLGGVLGRVRLEGLPDAWLPALALGGELHVGAGTGYGLGAYRLIAEGIEPSAGFAPARSMLARALGDERLGEAVDHVLADAEAAGIDGEEPAQLERGAGEVIADLRRRLLAGRYEPPPLRGWVLPKDDGGLRPLAVPTVRDRIAQRALASELSFAIDTLFEDCSFAYRKGFSRQGAARLLERAYADGFRYVLDADIRAFFDLVDWGILFEKLEALYPGEPALELVRRWVQAPVIFDGRKIVRRRGLPQGSPISPVLANLYLDELDEHLLEQGFQLARYADDFVILARSPAEAEQAREQARSALAELALELNEEETAVRTFEAGFTYLGYLFCRSLVLEEKDEEESERPELDLSSIPAASWLAEVPLERLEELVEGRGGDPRHGAARGTEPRLERRPLGSSAPLRGGRPFYVSSHETQLFVRGKTLIAQRPDGAELEVPIASLSSMVLCGRVRASVPLLTALATEGVPTYFCRASGELYATFGPCEPGSALWLEQARLAAEPLARLAFGRAVVAARVRNLAAVAVRFDWHGAREAAASMRELAERAREVPDAEVLLGLEGQGTRLGFEALAASLPAEWGFTGRRRQPPPDPFNALLSFGHTLLHNHVSTALVTAGLHPRIGLYHQPRGSHHALASDLQEELRHLVEALAWSMVSRRQLDPSDFRPSADGRYPALLTAEARPVFLEAFEERLATVFTTAEGEPLSYRSFIDQQARQMRALVRGEIAVYQPLEIET